MTYTDDLRARVKVALDAGTCPTCGQPTGASLRANAIVTGVSFSTLWRFLRGGKATSDVIDRLEAFLAARLNDTAPDGLDPAEQERLRVDFLRAVRDTERPLTVARITPSDVREALEALRDMSDELADGVLSGQQPDGIGEADWATANEALRAALGEEPHDQ